MACRARSLTARVGARSRIRAGGRAAWPRSGSIDWLWHSVAWISAASPATAAAAVPALPGPKEQDRASGGVESGHHRARCARGGDAALCGV